MRNLVLRTLLAAALCGSFATARALDPDVRQLIVGIAPDWNSASGHLQRFQRASDGSWTPASGPVPVLFGKNGLAWGRGIEGEDQPGLHKQERDGRAPAGVFRIGKIYTYDPALPDGASYPFHTVTDADAWVDNPASPDYNRFVTIPDPAQPPAWFEKEKMRHGDFAYRWLVEIRHNADPPKAGAGSAIFFHIRRTKDGELRPPAVARPWPNPNWSILSASCGPRIILLTCCFPGTNTGRNGVSGACRNRRWSPPAPDRKIPVIIFATPAVWHYLRGMMTLLASFGNLMGMDGFLIFLAMLLLFGAKKLPELARGLGQSLNEFKKAREDFDHELRGAQQDPQARAAADRQPYAAPAQPTQALPYTPAPTGAAAATEQDLQQQIAELQQKLRIAEEEKRNTPSSVS